MKKHFLTAVLGLSVLAFSCGSEDEDTPGITADQGTLTASVDGEVWLSSNPVASISDKYISIVAVNADGDILSMGVKSTSTGTYQTTTMDADGLPVFNAALTPSNVSMSNGSFSTTSQTGQLNGKITITELDVEAKIISGTFNIEMIRYNGTDGDSSIVFESGSFNKILLEEEDLQSNGTSTLSSKVDGQLFENGSTNSVISFGNLHISSFKSGGEAVTLIMPSDIATGSYSFGTLGSTYTASYAYSTNVSDIYYSASGTLNVTKHDTQGKHIQGTFSFVAKPFPTGVGSVTVTEGAFDVSY